MQPSSTANQCWSPRYPMPLGSKFKQGFQRLGLWQRGLWRLGLLLCCLVAVLSHGAPCTAIDFIEIIEKKKEGQHLSGQRFQIGQFDQWVFQNQTKAEQAEEQFLKSLETKIDSLQSTYQLTDDQKDKLALAGRGDIRAFMQKYAEVRARFAKNIQEPKVVQKIWGEIQPLRNKYKNLFDQNSLFVKIQGHTLDEQQWALLQKIRREQRLFQYRTAVRQLIVTMDQIAPTTHEKREQLLALINKHIVPPKPTAQHPNSHFLIHYVLGQFSEIPEEELRPLFQPDAWKGLQEQLKLAKNMKRQLEKQGIVPDKD